MNLTQESDGIKITINDAIFDGETVSITYSIESDRDLGENPTIFPMPTIMDSTGYTASSHISKIDEYHYVGLDRITPLPMTSDSADVKWNVASLFPNTDELMITGKWKFAFSLPATESRIQLTNQSVDQHGVAVTIDKVTFTPMSFNVHYTQQASEQVQEKWQQQPYVDLKIKDDVGNEYYGENKGQYGRVDYATTRINTFEKLDLNATKLIIIPLVTFSVYDEAKSEFRQEEFVMDDIVIELEK